MSMRIKERETPRLIGINKEVRVTTTKHIVQVMDIFRINDAFLKIHRIDKDTYYTDFPGDEGIIHQYKHTEKRSSNIAGVRRTQRQLRNYINNNFDGSSNELFITLTYAKNMKDYKKLYHDVEKWIKKMRYKYGSIDYIAVIEPQARGAWHVHILLRFNDKKDVYLDNNKDVWSLWEHGFTNTRKIKGVDNVGAYLTAYLADLEVNDENTTEIFNAMSEERKMDVVEREVEGKSKRFVKGARLHMYPTGINMFRCSRGIKKPEVSKMEYWDVREKIGDASADFVKTFDVIDEDGKILNSITYENYNLKRLKSQLKNNERHHATECVQHTEAMKATILPPQDTEASKVTQIPLYT